MASGLTNKEILDALNRHRERIARLQEEVAKAQGRFEAAKEALQKLGYETVGAAEKAQAKLEKQVADLDADIEGLLLNLEEVCDPKKAAN